MNNFTCINTLYEYLENEAFNFNNLSKISSEFRKLRDFYFKNSNNDLVKIAQLEMDVFNFIIDDNVLKPVHSGTNDKGEIIEYPSLTNFDETSYSYIKERTKNVTNPCLKARYNHLLWLSSAKHNSFAKDAINSYFELLKIYLKKEQLNSKELFSFSILNTIRNLYFLSVNIKHDTDKVIDKIMELVKSEDFETASSFLIKFSLIKLISFNIQKFQSEQIREIPEIIIKLSDLLKKDYRHFDAIHVLEIGEKIDNLNKTNSYNWYLNIAELYEHLMRISVSNINGIGFCQESIKYYKLCKNNKKVDELEHIFGEIKSKLEMSEFKTEIDLKDFIKAADTDSDSIVEENPDQILRILMFNESILPNYSEVERLSKETLSISPIRLLAAETFHDTQGNPVQHIKEYDEKIYHEIIRNFGMELNTFSIRFLHMIIYKAVSKDKLDSKKIYEFFKINTWFGKTIQKSSLNNKYEYNWLNLLMPSIHEYIFYLSNVVKNSNYDLNLIMPIDSLALKIEGLIRDLSMLNGGNTFYTTSDKKGRNISKEKDIHMLLYDDSIKSLFSDIDLILLRYLLVEQAGYNLRHKIAHSLMLYEEYSLKYMHLLFLCLLKIGKYDLVDKKCITSA